MSTRGNTVDGESPRAARRLDRGLDDQARWVVNIRKRARSSWSTIRDIKNLKTTTIESAEVPARRRLGTMSKRYFVAANASNKIARSTPRKASSPRWSTPKIPHPGRGANFTHPKFGPVWATFGDRALGHHADQHASDKPPAKAQRTTEGRRTGGAIGAATCSSRPTRSPKHLWADAAESGA